MLKALYLFGECVTGLSVGLLTAVAFVSFGATVPTSLTLGGLVACLVSMCAHVVLAE